MTGAGGGRHIYPAITVVCGDPLPEAIHNAPACRGNVTKSPQCINEIFTLRAPSLTQHKP